MVVTLRFADTARELKALNAFYADPVIGYKGNGKVVASDIVLVVEIEGELVGCVRLCMEEGVSVLRSMNIHPQYQRRGLGTRMLTALELMMKGGPCWCLALSHLETFYANIGFRHVPSTEGPLHLQKRFDEYRATQNCIMMVRYNSLSGRADCNDTGQ